MSDTPAKQATDQRGASLVGTDGGFGQFFEPPFTYQYGSIWGSGPGAEKLLDMRGWGHLIGGGAHGLKSADAEKIQDAIGEFIADLLNKHWPNTQAEPHL